jgi:hypothetical protein
MYFPRLLAFDRLRGRFELFANCGAVAGMLARSDETLPLWSAQRDDQLVLRPNMRPGCSVVETDRQRLAQFSINSFLAVRVAPDAADTLGPRKILALGAVIGGLGSFMFGLAPSLDWALAGRTLIGLGVSVTFIAMLKLIAVWFEENRFATMVGICMLVGNMG